MLAWRGEPVVSLDLVSKNTLVACCAARRSTPAGPPVPLWRAGHAQAAGSPPRAPQAAFFHTRTVQ